MSTSTSTLLTISPHLLTYRQSSPDVIYSSSSDEFEAPETPKYSAMETRDDEKDDALPFGYQLYAQKSGNEAIDPSLMAPPPPPGGPLLSADESSMMQHFLNDPSADLFGLDNFGDGIGFNDWLEQPPVPQFMGTFSGFGHEYQTDFSSPVASSSALPNAGGETRIVRHGKSAHNANVDFTALPDRLHESTNIQQPSSDVLQAAAFLHDGQYQSDHAHPAQAASWNHGSGNGKAIGGHSLGQLSVNQQNADFGFPMQPHTYAAQQTRPRYPAPMQFGSDQSFSNGQVFVPQAQYAAAVAAEDNHDRTFLDLLQHAGSSSASRPSSSSTAGEIQARRHASRPHDAGTQMASASRSVTTNSHAEANSYATGSQDAVSEEADGGNARKRKRPSVSSRKKPVAGQPRRNLTAQEKRENHIRSEQKRRQSQKKSYEDVLKMVPELRGGTKHSRADSLQFTGQWIESLKATNEELRAQLRAAGG